MGMKKFFLLIILFVYCLGSQAASYYLVTEPYPPYEFQENGKSVGMDVELIELAAKKVGITLRIEFIPWARCIEMMKQGSADGIFSLLHNNEREAFIYYPPTPLYVARSVLFARKNYSNKIEKMEDLKGKQVGVVYGNSYGEVFDRADYIKKESVADHETLMKKLIGRREELILTTEEVGYYLSRKLGGKDIHALPFTVSKDSFYIGVSKKSPRAKTLLKKLSEGLALIEKTGEAQLIRKKYLGN